MLLVTAVTVAQASTYYVSDVGVRSFARAGAFVAGVNDLTAFWYNPAALTRLKGGHAMVDLAGVGQSVYFDREDVEGGGLDGADVVNEPIENAAPMYLIPHLGVSYDFGMEDTVVGLGFFPPYAPDYQYPEDGAQRYTLTDGVVIHTYTGPGVAHEFFDWISVGATVSWNLLYIEQDVTVGLVPEGSDVEDPQYDVDFHLDAMQTFKLAWNAGVLVEPPSGLWAIGAMVHPPIHFKGLEGQMTADFSGNYYFEDETFGVIADETALDDYVRTSATMPLIIKAGALVRPQDNLEIEASFVWQGWSSIQEVTVTDVDMLVPIVSAEEKPVIDLLQLEDIEVTDDIVLETHYQDAWSVRLGGSFGATDRLTLHAGGLYEKSGIPPKYLSVSLVDGDKVGYGAGASVHLPRGFTLDAAMSQSFLGEIEITNSDVTSINVDPLEGNVYDGPVVGNGLMRSTITLIGGGVTWHFAGRDEG